MQEEAANMEPSSEAEAEGKQDVNVDALVVTEERGTLEEQAPPAEERKYMR